MELDGNSNCNKERIIAVKGSSMLAGKMGFFCVNKEKKDGKGRCAFLVRVMHKIVMDCQLEELKRILLFAGSSSWIVP